MKRIISIVLAATAVSLAHATMNTDGTGLDSGVNSGTEVHPNMGTDSGASTQGDINSVNTPNTTTTPTVPDDTTVPSTTNTDITTPSVSDSDTVTPTTLDNGTVTPTPSSDITDQ